MKQLRYLFAAGGLALAALVAAPAGAAATATPGHACSGTATAPGALAGSYFGDVQVQGVCAVNAGPAAVYGTLTVRPGSVLLAGFALNDQTGKGGSNLTVFGDVRVQDGATLILGCLASSFACADDPNQNNPTLSSHDWVFGSIRESQPLGVVVHNSWISGSVSERGGGGGFDCTPSGAFAQFQSPVYSDYEDSYVGGSLSISRLSSCWLGVARVWVGGNLRFDDNQLNDPDAIEILSNYVGGKLACHDNSMVWDSAETGQNPYPRAPEPNWVAGKRQGQCVLASPATPGGPPGPGPF